MTRVLGDFSARWSVCWATTYTFEPSFFETVIARRLGDPPRNIVVLADGPHLADLWRRIGSGERWSIRGANRLYLIRPVHIPGGVFHAKTILLANEREGELLVGSGNLGLSGLESGREVIVRYRSTSASGLAAIATWRIWMADLVAHVDEPVLRMRWARVLERCGWMAAESVASPFFTNWQTPLLDALVPAGSPSVDELHVTAPFFDADLRATTALIARARPRRITVYLGHPTSVDGPRLAETLGTSGAPASVLGMEPRGFVHAKLFATITGDVARLLSGSANASGPALLGTVAAGDGNVETASIAELSADECRALFVPPGASTVPIDAATLARFEFQRIAVVPSPPVRLTSATLGLEGFVTVVSAPELAKAVLTDGRIRLPIIDSRSREPIDADAVVGPVWLADGDGIVLSASVPLDIRAELDRQLSTHESGVDKPRDLDVVDLNHPLGRLLLELHRSALFDVDDTLAARHVQQRVAAGEEVDEEFWDRLMREELAADPRAHAYRSHARGEPGFVDDLAWLLEEMLHRAPSPFVLRLLSHETVDRETEEGTGRSWSADQKLAVRAYNVLARWSSAVSDPRVRWVSEFAPVRHYSALLARIGEIWPQGWIRHQRLRTLLTILFGAFIGTDRTVGFLGSLDEVDRARAMEVLASTQAPAVGAALASVALRGAGTDAYFEWQVFLGRAIAWGVFDPSEAAAALARALGGGHLDANDLQVGFETIMRYDDDAHWCPRVADELGLPVVRIRRVNHPEYSVEVDADGISDLLGDPRAPALAPGSACIQVRVGHPSSSRVGHHGSGRSSAGLRHGGRPVVRLHRVGHGRDA